jgi:hypothetical protein
MVEKRDELAPSQASDVIGANVSIGSITSVCLCAGHFRFAPNSEHGSALQ